jgi:DNA (cytosine-5)-methyltransferase 1
VAWSAGLRVGTAAALGGGGAPPDASASGGAPGTFRYCELFAGIGGFRLALDALGGRCVFASEVDPNAVATYRANFGHAPAGDITEVPSEAVPAHDLLVGGFPCQAYSRLGAQLGLAADSLFLEVVRIARAAAPSALLLENVPNLMRIQQAWPPIAQLSHEPCASLATAHAVAMYSAGPHAPRDASHAARRGVPPARRDRQRAPARAAAAGAPSHRGFPPRPARA